MLDILPDEVLDGYLPTEFCDVITYPLIGYADNGEATKAYEDVIDWEQ